MRVALALCVATLGLAAAPLRAQVEPTDLTGSFGDPTVLDWPCDNYCNPTLIACQSLALLGEPLAGAAVVAEVSRGSQLLYRQGRLSASPGLVIVRAPILNEDHYDRGQLSLERSWMPRLAARSWQPGDTIRPVAWVSDGDGTGAWLWWTGTEYGSGSEFWDEAFLADADSRAVLEREPATAIWIRVATTTGVEGWLEHSYESVYGFAAAYEDRERCVAP